MPARVSRTRLRLKIFARKLFFSAVAVAILFLWIGIKLHNAEPERVISATGQKVYVIDGDTLKIGDVRMRLRGIDAPEINQFCQDERDVRWSCGARARDALLAFVGQGDLACVDDGVDKYRRMLTHCSAHAIDDIGAALVTAGWAINLDNRGDGYYLREQEEAKREKRGIWRGAFQQPAAWRASKNGSAPLPIGE